jgi:PAS domain S-box-containing protein
LFTQSVTASISKSATAARWKKYSRACALLVLAIATVGLIGWILHIDLLTRLHPSLVSMKFNTAIALFIAAASLLLLQNESAGSSQRLGQAGGIFVIAVGLLTLVEILFHRDLGIDQFFFQETVESAGRSFPGRMGFASTLIFILFGTGLYCLPKRNRVSSICAMAGGVLTLLIFLVYFYRIESLEKGPLSLYLTIALHTVVAFIAFSLGILLARPEYGIMKFILGDTVGGKIARRMLPSAVLLPIFLGWLRTLGRDAGLFGPGFGTATFVSLIILIFLGLIWWAVLVINREEAERKRAEEATRESEAQFRTMADNIGDLAWMANADGAIFFYNQRWYDYTGTTLEEMQGWGWQKVHHPDHTRRVFEKWNLHLKKGEAWEDTFPLRGKDGQYRWFLSRAFPIREADGNIVRWFGTNTDITELREAQKKLQEHADTLEHKIAERTADLKETNEQLEAFVYSIAHDLRAPLRAMQAFAQLLVEDHAGGLDETARHYLTRIKNSSEFMDRMILDLLAFGRTARSEVTLETVDVTAIWNAALYQCSAQIEQTKARIEAAPALPLVRAHEATLAQVMANLLNNAIKFVPPGVQPRIRFWTEDRGSIVRLWLQDNGVGIAPEHQERIFRVFERLHGATYPGTGIGLSIVRKGVERMGGKLGLESELGHGTRFWIELQKE